jgi:hypothetical protein
LIREAERFYNLFCATEERYVGACRCDTGGGRFTRVFVPRVQRGGVEGVLSAADIGMAIAAYVKAFDRALKAYFSLLGDGQNAAYAVDGIYRDYILNASYLI